MNRKAASNTYFTSDLHFGHANVIEYSNRPFASVPEMDAKLISNWNATVRPQDLVYVLGDFFMYHKKEVLRDIVSQLNGTKILVRGNHDMGQSEMLNLGFAAVVENAEIIIANERVLLSHYPYKRSKLHDLFWTVLYKIAPKRFFKPRKFTKQLEDKGLWLLHGHVHSPRKYFVPGKKMIHVGVDAWDYKPVSIQKIGNMIAEIRNGVYNE